MQTIAKTLIPICAMLALQMPALAVAQPQPAPAERLEVTLDIDQDGKMDRALIMRDPTTGGFDLSIYLATDNKKCDLARKPAIFKKDIASRILINFRSTSKGALVLTSGCGGCSNDDSITLTVVHRGGQFLVAGFTLDWDTRNGAGTCDINFLTGKGTMSRNLSRAKPLTGRFKPIKLVDWSYDKRPSACEV